MQIKEVGQQSWKAKANSLSKGEEDDKEEEEEEEEEEGEEWEEEEEEGGGGGEEDKFKTKIKKFPDIYNENKLIYLVVFNAVQKSVPK